MKNLLIFIHLILLCCLIVGCQQSEEVAIEADIQDIKDIVADFNIALNAGDIDKASFYYADEVVVISPIGSPGVGKETCISNLQQLFDRFVYEEVDVVKNVEIGGDLAVAHVAWSGIYTPKDGGEPRKSNGNWIMVLRKQPDSAWKFIYQIWTNERLIYPEQAG